MSKEPIYLAGPDVFLSDVQKQRIREIKGKICAEFGFKPVFPVDGSEMVASEIFGADCSLMSRTDVKVGLFNLSPFRGPSADPGTVFELGYMYALGKRVFGYTNSESDYRGRIKGWTKDSNNKLWDQHGYFVEDYKLADNLMVECAVLSSGGVIKRVKEQPVSERDPLAALEAFRACLRELRSRIP
jgi:nucleoside 2-deoxyribosyltransferase